MLEIVATTFSVQARTRVPDWARASPRRCAAGSCSGSSTTASTWCSRRRSSPTGCYAWRPASRSSRPAGKLSVSTANTLSGSVRWRSRPRMTTAVRATPRGCSPDRAQAVRDDFQLDEHNTTQIDELCRRLDGIPLAIELAASRTASMTVSGILEHLDERFRLLTGGRRVALERQQTLRGTLDWSYSLLNSVEQHVFTATKRVQRLVRCKRSRRGDDDGRPGRLGSTRCARWAGAQVDGRHRGDRRRHDAIRNARDDARVRA